MRICFIGLIAFTLVSCEKKQEKLEISLPVSAMKVVKQTIPQDYQFVAVAESSHIVELRARVEGYLEEIDYQEGEIVQLDQKMFVLDQRPFLAAVDEAKGMLDQKKAKLWDAKRVEERMVALYKENAVSQRDRDNAIANALATQADVNAAQANLEKANINLSFTTITAPVEGMASRAIFREGALISPGPNSLLTNIYVIDPIWVNFSASEGDILSSYQERQEGTLVFPKDHNFSIEIVLPTGQVFPAEGKINFLDPALQQSTGTMLIRSILKNPGRILRPGMFVKAVVKGAYRPNAVIVPQSAVLMGQGGAFVFVVNESNTTIVRPVKLGQWYKDYWIINKGLNEGDVVISTGVNRVQNGQKVVINHWVPSTPSEKKENPSNGSKNL